MIEHREALYRKHAGRRSPAVQDCLHSGRQGNDRGDPEVRGGLRSGNREAKADRVPEEQEPTITRLAAGPPTVTSSRRTLTTLLYEAKAMATNILADFPVGNSSKISQRSPATGLRLPGQKAEVARG